MTRRLTKADFKVPALLVALSIIPTWAESCGSRTCSRRRTYARQRPIRRRTGPRDHPRDLRDVVLLARSLSVFSGVSLALARLASPRGQSARRLRALDWSHRVVDDDLLRHPDEPGRDPSSTARAWRWALRWWRRSSSLGQAFCAERSRGTRRS